MRRFWKSMTKEWEFTALAGAALLLVLYGAAWGLDLGAGEEESERRRDVAARTSRLCDNAFLFLEDIPALNVAGRSPFAFRADLPTARRPRPKPPEPEPEPDPEPEPEPVVTPEPEPVQPNPPQPRPRPRPVVRRPRYGARVVRYMFCQMNPSGKHIALVHVLDPATGRKEALSLGVGDAVAGIEVRSFNEESLVLIDAAGRKQQVRLMETRKVLSRAQNTGRN